MQSTYNKIISRIYGHGKGWTFSKKDFSDLGSRGAIDIALHRLNDAKIIRRIARGLYDYPIYSELLKQQLSPDLNQIAKALSRKYGWTICPDGETALNLLGLSTQVPARITYLSNGATKQIQIGNQRIYFKNTNLKETQLKDDKSTLIVQALKALGKERIDDNIISSIKKQLTQEDKKRTLKNTKYITDWIYEAILKICNG
jgi:hypothetical protein